MVLEDDITLYGKWTKVVEPEKTDPPKPPRTGDSTMPDLWLSMLAVGGLGLTAVTRRKKEN